MAEPFENTPRVERFRGVDRTFLAIVAGVFLFNFGLASAVASRAKTWSDDWALMEEVIASGRIASFLPAPPAKPEKKGSVKQADVGASVASTGSSRGTGGPKKPSASLDRLVKTVGLTSLIGSRGVGDGTDLVDELWGGHEATSLEKAMQDARAQGREVRLDGGGERRGPATGEARSIGEIETGGGAGEGAKKLADRGPARPRPSVTFEQEEDDPVPTPGCDRAAVAKAIKRNLTALQYCYEYETKKIQTLHGKVVVRFTVEPNGRASEVEIDEDSVGSPGLRRCIERTVRGWAFPAAQASCEYSHPFVFTPAP